MPKQRRKPAAEASGGISGGGCIKMRNLSSSSSTARHRSGCRRNQLSAA